MKIGDIKAEALRLMYLTGTQYISAGDIDDLLTGDDNLSHYLHAMTGSINRALSDIERRSVLRPKSVVMTGDIEDGLLICKVSDVPDFLAVDYISYRDGQDYSANVDYTMDGTDLIVPYLPGTYLLHYKYSIPRLTAGSDNESDLSGVLDRVASLIPYYIKGDLFSEDEPGAAAEARNWYEAGMASLAIPPDIRNQGAVSSVYRFEGD